MTPEDHVSNVATIQLYAPARWLNSNDRPKRRPNEVIQAWRFLAENLTHKGIVSRIIQPFPGRVHITAELRFPDNRRRDAANYYPTIKACIDGIVAAKLIVDDSDRYVDALTIRRGPRDPRGLMVITVTEVA